MIKYQKQEQELITRVRDGRFGSKVGQIDPKCDKSEVFLVHLGSASELKSHLKKNPDLSYLGQI